MDAYQDWQNAREKARRSIADIIKDGRARARAEAEYYREKSLCAARLKTRGYSVSMVSIMVKGDKEVNRRLFEFREADAIYCASKNAAALYIDEEAHTYDAYKRSFAGDSERF